jgi:hypothetical protein
MSYMATEHADWHAATGTPSGPMGGSCPWDACGWMHAELAEAERAFAAEQAEWAALAPELREGEEPAPLTRYGYRPDEWDVPSPF